MSSEVEYSVDPNKTSGGLYLNEYLEMRKQFKSFNHFKNETECFPNEVV